MERRRFLLGAALGGLGLAGAAFGIGRGLLGWGDSAPDWHLPLQPPILGAHRGGARFFPEHTLAAYVGSYARFGCRFMELDVRASRDGVPVVIHDATVDRTTDGSGAVSAMTLAELRSLDAGFRFRGPDGESWAGRGLRIPTLLETLRELPECVFSVEIKQADPPMEREVVEAVRQAGMERRVLLGSARHDLYQRVRALAPELPTFFTFRSGMRLLVAALLGLGSWYRPMHNVLLTPERMLGLNLTSPRLLKAVHRLGIPVLVFTVDAPEAMERLLAAGVDGVITDRPDVLAEVVRKRSTAVS